MENYLSTELTEVLAVLTDLHLFNLLTQTSTISGTWSLPAVSKVLNTLMHGHKHHKNNPKHLKVKTGHGAQNPNEVIKTASIHPVFSHNKGLSSESAHTKKEEKKTPCN